MSKIGTEVIVGQMFKPIVTTFTYDELQNYRDNDVSIGINNALIFSIPQQGLDNDTYVDANNETSIWATDNSGLLCPLSFPYSMIEKIKDSLDTYEKNTINRKIISASWSKTNGTSVAGESPNINIKVNVKYANDKSALLNITGIKVYKNAQFTEEYTTIVVGSDALNWYNRAGIYYIQGLIADTSTGNIVATTNEMPLVWTITTAEKSDPVCVYDIIYHDDDNYAEVKLTANTLGRFELFDNDDYNITVVNETNTTLTFNLYNTSYNTINATLKYRFIPDDETHYNSIVLATINIEDLQGVPNENDYYIYIGLEEPTISTDPDNDLASNNTPLYEEYGAMGWRNIGSDISVYNLANPAFNGGGETVILNEEFNYVTCYIVIPVEMDMYDGFGHIMQSIIVQPELIIKDRKYKVLSYEAEGEFANLIY